MIIYTDGSAVPNPGRIGLGVALILNNHTQTISATIGIGSILTAELAAILAALKKMKSLVQAKEPWH